MFKKTVGLILVAVAFVAMSALTFVVSAPTQIVRAQEGYETKIYDRIGEDFEVLARIQDALGEENYEEMYFLILNKKPIFETSYRIYRNRPSNLSSYTGEIAEKVEKASAKIIEGAGTFERLEFEELTDYQIESAGNMIADGIVVYYEVMGRMDEDISEYYLTRNFYLYSALIGLIIGLIIYVMRRIYTVDHVEELAKDTVLSLAMKGFFYIAGGLGITFASFEFSESGSYYIMYGSALYGGYLILKSLYYWLRYRKNWVLLIDDLSKKAEAKKVKKTEVSKDKIKESPYINTCPGCKKRFSASESRCPYCNIELIKEGLKE